MGSSDPTATESRVLGGTLQGGGGNEKKNGKRRNDDAIIDRDHNLMIDTVTGNAPGNIDYDHSQDNQSGNHNHQHWQWRSIDLTSHQKWNTLKRLKQAGIEPTLTEFLYNNIVAQVVVDHLLDNIKDLSRELD
jgi:hypothetical protein